MENFLFAFRYLLKLRGSNLIRIVSLSLGLTVGLLLFSYSYYRLTADRCFRDGDRIWQMWASSEMFGTSSQMNAPFAPAFVEEVPCVEAATRIRSSNDNVVRGDNTFPVRYIYADTLFFETLGFEVLQGNPKEILLHEDQAMLSESVARTIFGDKDPLGQQLLLGGSEPLTVMGVFRDPPSNQHLGKFDMLLSFEQVKKSLNTSWNGGDSFPTYIKLRQGTSIAEFEAAMPAFYERHSLRAGMDEWGQKYLFYPIADASKVESPAVLVSWLLITLGALTLFIAAMNYVLISVSTLVSRSRTIAMLKVGGARRRDIFAIFCWETALLLGISVGVAAFLIWGLQVQVTEVTGTPVGELFALERIWLPGCAILAAFALAALIPAQLFTAVPVTLAFRGAAANRRRWKHVLLFTEVVSVTLVTILLLVFYLQFDRLRFGDFGFEHDRLVYTQVQTPFNRMGAICDEMVSMPEVEAAGASEDIPMWGYSGQPCFDEKSRELLFSCRWTLAGEGFIPVMGMRMAAGRNFTPSSDPLEAIVNQTYVRMRGWTPEQAVGRQIVDNDDPKSGLYTIVGVVNDYRTLVANGLIEPVVIHPLNYYLSWGISPENKLGYYLLIRLREMTPEALDAVRRKVETLPSDNRPTLRVYDDLLGEELADIRSYRSIVLMVCSIVLLIALTGLIGYLGDEIRRRSKEVAIRKVNGAGAGAVIRLLGREVALLCVPAMAVGAALGWWCGGLVVSMFVERIALIWWIFALCATVVAVIVAAVQLLCTWRIANANPVNMIKTE